MSQSRKTNILVILIFLGVIVAFACAYNVYVTTVVTDAAYNDKEILHRYNDEIILKLVAADSVRDWNNIVEQYEDIVIAIEDSSNNIVTKSEGRTWTALDVKVQTPFEYRGKAYLIKSSVYLLRDYNADVRTMVEFIFAEFLIGLSALALLIFTIYSIMLRPFKHVYKSIEEYDRTGTLEKKKIKGYAGQVYNRFVSLTENLNRQQQNETRIIASISHDIKTPLTSIMGYTEQLKRDDIKPDRRRRYLDTVYDKSAEIQQLIDEFDEYLSFNMSKELVKQKVTTNELEKYLMDEYYDELRTIGVDFEVVNEAEKAEVLIDKQKFRRVFGNIFSNSVKHFDKNEKKIRVIIRKDKGCVTVEIHDNGEGLSDVKPEDIFEPFYTSDMGRKVAGLGLSICREIITAHNGEIYAQPSALGGLMICFTLKTDK